MDYKQQEYLRECPSSRPEREKEAEQENGLLSSSGNCSYELKILAEVRAKWDQTVTPR